MACGVDFIEHLGNFAFAVDNIGDALGVTAAIYIVGFGYGSIYVCKQLEGQTVLFGEFLVGGFIIGANSQHYHIFALVFWIRIPKALGFFSATGGVVFGVKVQNYGFTLEIRQLHHVAVGVFDGKIRCYCAYC